MLGRGKEGTVAQMSSIPVSDLRAWIDGQPQFLGNTWLDALESRKKEEAQFHDEDRKDGRDLSPELSENRRYYEAADIVFRATHGWIASRAPGGDFLDYACGSGATTIYAATAGANLAVGIDISPVTIEAASRRAREADVADRTRFLQRDCEDTGFPDASFDTCLCSGMLHHLDLTRGFPELHRIMKPRGRILCVEALSYNPVIQAYRRFTPRLRTQWEREHILGLKELRYATRWFRVENVRFFLLVSPLATLLPKGIMRRAGLAAGHAIDAVLTRIPGLQLWSWQFTFELVKVR